MRALVTRPREDAAGIAAELESRGLAVALEPLLDIRYLDGVDFDKAGLQGILATSANGIRALARVWDERSLPVWAVGDASARAARDSGYAQVESASGDVDKLAELVAARCRPADGAFLHAAASVTAGDLAGMLEAKGFAVRRAVLYQALPAESLSPEAKVLLASGQVDRALFFSPRTAATFARLVQAEGGNPTARITAYALSANVAEALKHLPWAALRVAAEPTQAALLAALDHDLAPEDSMTEAQDAEKPAEIPDEAAKPEEKGANWLAIAVALALIAIIGVGAATWPDWKDLVLPPKVVKTTVETPRAPDEAALLRAEIGALRDRLAAVETRGSDDSRLTQAEAALRALQAQPQVPARLTAEVEELGKQVTDLKRTSADAAAVLRLADRVEKVEAEMRELQARRSSATAILLAAGQLREAVKNALPYDSELRALQALAPNDGEVAAAAQVLKPRAAAGIPTALALSARFAALAPEIVRAQVLPETQSWWRQTLDRLANLVVIRREDGNAAGDDAAARVARAEQALAQGQLDGAVTEVKGLEGGPAQAAALWLADAQARLDADQALSQLTAHVVAQVGARQ